MAMLEHGLRGVIEEARRDPIASFVDYLESKKGISLSEIHASPHDFSYLAPEQRAESYWALFQEAKSIASGRMNERLGKKQKERLTDILSLFKALHDDNETQAIFKENYERHLYEVENLNGNKEKYLALRQEIANLENLYDAAAKELFSHRGDEISEYEKIIFETTQNQLNQKRQDLENLFEASPRLWAHAMYENLRGYSRELREKRFMWTPSRRGYKGEMIAAALGRKPLLISGESGTGKTQLVDQLALVLTGQPMVETPGKDIRFQDLIAKRSFKKEGESEVVFYEFAEIGEAVTGKKTTLDEKPVHNGRVVGDDEYNLLDESEQNTRLSRISNWPPGKKIKLPVTNTDETVASNFLYCAMVNLASDRYSRKRIPPEVLRKFAKVDVDYVPQTKEDPELYEMLLGALIDGNGRLRALKAEIAPEYAFEETSRTTHVDGQTVEQKIKVRHLVEKESEGGFLWRFANALNELNKSFSHKQTVLSARAEAQFLKDLVLDVGTVLKWLSDYRTVGRKMNLEAYISEKIEAEFLTKAAYTQDDRQLLKDFLKHYGIDTQKAIANPDPVEGDVLTPQDIGLLSPRVQYKEVLSTEPVLAEGVAIIEGKRQEYTRVMAEWTDASGRKLTIQPGACVERGGAMYEYLGLAKGDNEPILVRVEKVAKRGRPKSPERSISLEEAESVMGVEHFFGPDALLKAFGLLVEVPPIPFNAQELQEARARGEMLILRSDKLTMKQMADQCQKAPQWVNKGKVLASVDWYANEQFYTSGTCRPGWALVSKEVVPTSKNKNYLLQTDEIIAHLKTNIYKTGLPKEYQDAVDEFMSQRSSIEQLMKDDSTWRDATQKLADLKITQLTRHSAQEVILDMLTVFLNSNDERILKSLWTWTGTRGSDGDLVSVGDFDAGGADVGGSIPDDSFSTLGVLLSRRG